MSLLQHFVDENQCFEKNDIVILQWHHLQILPEVFGGFVVPCVDNAGSHVLSLWRRIIRGARLFDAALNVRDVSAGSKHLCLARASGCAVQRGNCPLLLLVPPAIVGYLPLLSLYLTFHCAIRSIGRLVIGDGRFALFWWALFLPGAGLVPVNDPMPCTNCLHRTTRLSSAHQHRLTPILWVILKTLSHLVRFPLALSFREHFMSCDKIYSSATTTILHPSPEQKTNI